MSVRGFASLAGGGRDLEVLGLRCYPRHRPASSGVLHGLWTGCDPARPHSAFIERGELAASR